MYLNLLIGVTGYTFLHTQGNLLGSVQWSSITSRCRLSLGSVLFSHYYWRNFNFKIQHCMRWVKPEDAINEMPT